MLPLIPLAISLIPDLVHLLAGDKAGTLADTISNTVADVTKTKDPAAALQAIQADTAAAAELRAKLAQIAVDAQKVQNDEADKQRADQLTALQANMANTADARSLTEKLAADKSPLAWGAPAVSIVVTLGFFVVLAIIIYGKLDTSVSQIVNISIGTLATAFATVVNFWLGSSKGSQDKDAAAVVAQAANTAQVNNVLATVKTVTSSAIAAAQAPAKDAPAAAIVAKPDNFDRCIAVILAYEGGFTDNANDPGGASNFGITRRTLEAFTGHAVSVDDVKNLSSGTAIEIYRANYWNQMMCASLPAGIDLMIFDYGVNSGPAVAIRALQKLVGVTQDGAIGKITLPAVLKLPAAGLINDLAAQRLAFLKGLETFATFGDGWTRRVADVQQKSLQMAATAHPAAVS